MFLRIDSYLIFRVKKGYESLWRKVFTTCSQKTSGHTSNQYISKVLLSYPKRESDMIRNLTQKLYTCIQSYLIVVLCLLLSCSPQSSVQERTQKFLSLNPAITETIFYLEAQEQLLGRSDYCTTPSQVQELPSFGTALTPNFEAIARVQPKSIFTDVSSGTQLKSLEQLAPVVQLPWLSVDDIHDSIIKLGNVLDKKEDADKLASKIKSTFVSAVASDSRSLLMLMEGSDVQKGQLWFMKQGSLHGAAIEAAGFKNGAPDIPNGPPSMSIEQLIQQDPDMIVFLTAKPIEASAQEKLIRSLDIIPNLQAVKNNKVGVIGGQNLMGVGPGAIQLVQKIKEKGRELLGSE